MADISTSALSKKKKVSLPVGWLERFTKKHPDKPYYFNVNTGESRWTPPVNDTDKTMEKQRGRKRKNRDDEEKETIDPPAEPKNKDTPAMQQYREKMAQRKAALEAKKNTSKSKSNLNKMVTPQKMNGNGNISKPSVQTRLRRSSVVLLKDNDSTSSDASIVSNASMGSKIKQLVKIAEPVSKTLSISNKEISNSPQSIRNLSKIPKVQITRAKLPTSSDSLSDYGTMSDNCPNNVSVSTGKSKFGTPKRLNNNLANERLTKLRKSLSTEEKKPALNKRARRTIATDCNYNDSEMIDQKMNQIKQVKSVEEEVAIDDKKLLEKCEVADLFCEQMDWEPIEDEKITFEVYSVRHQLCEKPAKALSELSCHIINSGHIPKKTNALYIIIDTNVFLSNLPFVEEVRDSQSEKFGRPFIVIPWTVLQELDYIKDNKDNSRSHALKLNARKAVDFLNKHFSAKHPRFLGQTPTDVEKNKQLFSVECPDDEILQTCLQVKDSTRTAVLLSYDKNLCTKAMIHDIITLGRDEPLEKIFFLKAAETKDFLSNSLHTHIEEKAEDVTIAQKEIMETDDIIEEAKAIIKSVLSEVVSKEMETLFGNRWEMHVIIRPPWSVATVLKCALKHWMGAVSFSFKTRKIETMLHDLLEQINNVPEGGRKLNDAKQFLEKCNDIVQGLDSSKYDQFKIEALDKLEKLNQRCTNIINELNGERLKLSVGLEPNVNEEERRAFIAFQILEDIYNYSRDICGIASDTLGLQCSIQYNKFNSVLTPKIAIEHEKDVGVNVNRLCQALEVSLARLNEDIQPNDQIIYALYETIMHFSSDVNFKELPQLTPLDLFCCLKHRKPQIEKGIDQLQELCVHFARMASHQCLS
ncbi:transcriptional protein SWT1-like isoform X2 [Phymastichus coffea]|uniref:transcriptional protein SWT1-like isoform X2 n=1 Tax=Phymastichus coffea TaxID=108790 RepID=UPI00273C25D7|nr:transcriptional protein SWT1-like isoform X2 [Phymastichus coffea]